MRKEEVTKGEITQRIDLEPIRYLDRYTLNENEYRINNFFKNLRREGKRA